MILKKLVLVLALVSFNAVADMAPDGSYVGGTRATMAPDGSYVGGTESHMAPKRALLRKW